MRSKHVHISQDYALQKQINREVEQLLRSAKKRFALTLVVKFIFYAALVAGLYYGLYFIRNPWCFLLDFVAFGYAGILFALNFAHDFAHNTVFKNKNLNNLGFTILFTLLGAHAASWKQRHIHSHHLAPNVDGHDPDLKISKIIRILPDSPYYWYHRYQHLYAPLAYTIYSLFWIFVKDIILLWSKDEYTQKKGWEYHFVFWLQKAVYLTLLLVLPLKYAIQPWYWVVAGFLLMHFLQSLFLIFTFFMTHHVETTDYPALTETGCIKTSWFMNQVRSSNDMHPFSKFANFIFGGFNNHVAHHLFPQYHHIYYPDISRMVYRILRQNGIEPNHTTYWGGVLSHWRLLRMRSEVRY